MKDTTKFVGIDVSQDKISVAVGKTRGSKQRGIA
ncbi:hypothetical protein J2Z65_006170 [Paenibacillus aceris]|uniref:IS110 family transposase n=1 Tax=Paenibacillus aceris TaxID=869555 RepID=A0ABS4IA09_9BACL|nr:hypothetical protein [Paenibacillus aceris]